MLVCIFELQCEEKGMTDFLQIGVSSGMDAAKMAVADSVCGQARNISKFLI